MNPPSNAMTNLPIPERGSALTADWMQQALRAGIGAGPVIKDMSVEDIGAGSGALGEILRCTLNYEGDGTGTPGSVVVKLRSSDQKSIRIAKLLNMYKREYNCFRRLAPDMPIRLPALLYGDWEEASHRFVLIFEDLREREMETMDQISGADAAQARRAIRGVAELHGQFWNKLDRPPVSNFLASVGSGKRWVSQLLYLTCLAPCLRRFGSLFSNKMRRLAEAYGPRLVVHMDELDSGPQTLTHGDFRLANMFFGIGKSDEFAVIDWQTSGFVTNGLYDVAYFMATSVSTEVRREIERDALKEYHEIIRRMGAKDISLADCWRLYRQSMLNMLVPCVCACGGLDITDPRMHELGKAMVQRTLTAIEDLDAHEFLHVGGRSSASTRLFSLVSSGAYRAYSILFRLCRPLA